MTIDYPFTDMHNSGVMVIEPHKKDYFGLIKIMKEKMKKGVQLGDQDIINEYFKEINTLPKQYNLMRQIMEKTKNEKSTIWEDYLDVHLIEEYGDVDNKKILHYIIYPKPFQLKHQINENLNFLIVIK